MKLEITVPEVRDLIKEIQQRPEDLFEMIRVSVKENVGHYLSELMDMELTDFLGRGRYERCEGDSNHRNGSYGRHFTLKGIGEVPLKVPRDREGDFRIKPDSGRQWRDRKNKGADWRAEFLCRRYSDGRRSRENTD